MNEIDAHLNRIFGRYVLDTYYAEEIVNKMLYSGDN